MEEENVETKQLKRNAALRSYRENFQLISTRYFLNFREFNILGTRLVFNLCKLNRKEQFELDHVS